MDFLNAVLRLEGGGKDKDAHVRLRSSPAVPRPRARDVLLRHPRDDGRREGGGRGDAAARTTTRSSSGHCFTNAFLTVKAKTESAARLAAPGADRTERAYRRYELPEIGSGVALRLT